MQVQHASTKLRGCLESLQITAAPAGTTAPRVPRHYSAGMEGIIAPSGFPCSI